MGTMKDCPEIPALIAFALGDTDGDGMADIAEHVAVCDDCGGLVADAADFPDLKPPEGVAPLSAEELALYRDALRLKIGRHVSPRLIAAYCVGAITSATETLVAEHLANCQRCADAMTKLIDEAVPAGWAEGEGEFAESNTATATKKEGEEGGDGDVLRLLTQIGLQNWHRFLASGGEELWKAEGDE